MVGLEVEEITGTCESEEPAGAGARRLARYRGELSRRCRSENLGGREINGGGGGKWKCKTVQPRGGLKQKKLGTKDRPKSDYALYNPTQVERSSREKFSAEK